MVFIWFGHWDHRCCSPLLRKSVVCLCSLLWSLSDKGTRVRFCWVPSHCGIDGNERVDQLAKETLDQDIDPLASVDDTDMKPLVNSYIQKLVQTKCDAHSSSIWSMVSVWPQWWQPVGGPRDRIWDLVALVWPIRSRVITTSSALVRCWNFLGGPSIGFTRERSLPCTATSHLVWTNFWV